MSVAKKIVFCEGEDRSYDAQLLFNLKPTDVTIVPTGGKFTFTNFAKGYLSSNKVTSLQGEIRSDPSDNTSQRYIVFRD